MDRLQVGISRCSLALSLAVALGLAGWSMLALPRSPTVGVALTAPGEQVAKVQGSVELAQARKQKHRARSRRERDETETRPQKGSGA